ncbi:MAG: hypothetical protein ABR517_07760 [Thermoanaerobaculia bacterium]
MSTEPRLREPLVTVRFIRLWAFDTGIGSGSLVMGWLVQHGGFRNAFLVAAAVSVLSIPVFRMTAPLIQRQK